jgi:hypothetical protein
MSANFADIDFNNLQNFVLCHKYRTFAPLKKMPFPKAISLYQSIHVFFPNAKYLVCLFLILL